MGGRFHIPAIAKGAAVCVAVYVIGLLVFSSVNPLWTPGPSALIWLPPIAGPLLGGAAAAAWSIRSPMTNGAAAGAFGSFLVPGVIVLLAGSPLVFLIGVIAVATLLGWLGAIFLVSFRPKGGV